MVITFVDPLSRAVERMRQILFQPFDLVKWLVLGFSAWLAGLASGAGGGTGASNFDSDEWDRPGHVLREYGHVWDRLLDNVFLLPHIGSATVETRDAMGFRAIDNLIAIFKGEQPGDRVA